MVVGKWYSFTIYPDTWSVGTLQISIAGNTFKTVPFVTGAGVIKYVFKALTTDSLVITPSADCDWGTYEVQVFEIQDGELEARGDIIVNDMDGNKGLILWDNTLAAWYRVQLDNGVLTITAV
jgi:hypothetical protein